MKFDQAKTVAELALNISDELNSILIELLKDVELLKDADAEKVSEYKQLVGSIMGEIYFGLLRPVYDLYPELSPDALKTKS
jgi:hypothetical protein